MNKQTAPTCNHCGYEFDEEETWYTPSSIGDVYKGDGDVSELICPNLDCGKTFYVNCVHDISFITCDEDGQDV